MYVFHSLSTKHQSKMWGIFLIFLRNSPLMPWQPRSMALALIATPAADVGVGVGVGGGGWGVIGPYRTSHNGHMGCIPE